MTREDYERAAAVQRIAGERLKRGRDVSAGEILARSITVGMIKLSSARVTPHCSQCCSAVECAGPKLPL